MSFHLAAPSDSDASSGSDLDDLPFPAPLAADAFQTPAGGDGSEETFSPTAFLASLRNRHQTLEDLRTELRTRARDLERELVDLVNRDYADFAGLGPSVRGGEAKVADLQVGMLAFRRDVEGVAAAVERVQSEVDREMKEKAEIRRQKMLSRNLLTLVMRLDELSSLLLLNEKLLPLLFDDEGDPTGIKRLRKCVTSWVYMQRFAVSKLPPGHLLLLAQKPRMNTILDTLCVDLRSALKEAREKRDTDRCLELLGMLADIGKEAEGVRALKEAKKL